MDTLNIALTLHNCDCIYVAVTVKMMFNLSEIN